MYGNISIIIFILVADNDINVWLVKTHISTYFKNLKIKFSDMIKNLPYEEFQWILKSFVKM